MMKTITKILIISLICINGIGTINAQFLKKLQQRVQEAAEETVIRKVEDKAAEKTGEGVDKVLNMNFKNIFNKNFSDGSSSIDPSEVPESYDFEWKYTMQMQTKEGSFIIEYFLKSEVKYFGSKPNIQQNTEGSMIIVMDIERNINTVFMDMGDSKMATPMSIPDEMTEESDDVNLIEDYTFEEIGTKNILGYKCQGFKMENDENKMIIYMTTDAPVSFSQIYGVDTKKMPKGFNPKWLRNAENSLVMEMDYTDKKKKQNTAKMVCIALNEEAFSINKSDYQFMNLNMSNVEE